jgi:hypothetical protein
MNKKVIKAYRNKEWFKFSYRVKERDDFKCVKCHRDGEDVILQCHHTLYRPNFKLWDYSLSDCITLCKGCHAREHNLIEPNAGWVLLEINDLLSVSGKCERANCDREIRYEHITYHPDWGYKIVGSTCIHHLTKEDKFLSAEVLKLYKNISSFVNNSEWETGITKNDKFFNETTHAHHKIRIYGNENDYAFQIALKEKGKRWYDYAKPIKTNKNYQQTKELAYIVLKGMMVKKEHQKEILRDLYSRIS